MQLGAAGGFLLGLFAARWPGGTALFERRVEVARPRADDKPELDGSPRSMADTRPIPADEAPAPREGQRLGKGQRLGELQSLGR